MGAVDVGGPGQIVLANGDTSPGQGRMRTRSAVEIKLECAT